MDIFVLYRAEKSLRAISEGIKMLGQNRIISLREKDESILKSIIVIST